MPILTNPLTKEPYIPLPTHPNIILTPPRPNSSADEAALVTNLNNPLINQYLETTPIPYLPEHAVDFNARQNEDSSRHLAAAQTQQFVDGMPFTCIREVLEDGSDVRIGDVGLKRYRFYEVGDKEEKEERVKANNELPVGSGEIIWGFGDFLAPSHHGKGIMTAVVRAVMDEWAIPRMNARVVKACVFAGNIASIRVFEKNGFFEEYALKDWVIMSESRGGGRRSIHLLTWKAEGEAVHAK